MRYRSKSYWPLPFGLGEVQYGHVSHHVTVWFRGRCYQSPRWVRS